MKITVDRDRCTGLGICESLAPAFFEIDDEGAMVVLTDVVAAGNAEVVEQAVSSCPTEALRLL